MPETMELKPQRLESSKLVIEELPDELMIYDQERNKAFCLNQSAAFVWKHANGQNTVSELAELMARNLGKPVSEDVVLLALEALSKDGLLQSSPVAPEVFATGMTRRSMLRRMGMGAAVAVPLVTALVVSPAKAHASSTGSGPVGILP